MNETEKLAQFYKQTVNWTLRITKPWKRKHFMGEDHSYDNGWNDCIKEMTKNGKRLKIYVEKQITEGQRISKIP